MRSNGYGRDWSMGVGEVRERYLSKEAASQTQGSPTFTGRKPEANDLSFQGDWAPCPREKWVCEELQTLAAFPSPQGAPSDCSSLRRHHLLILPLLRGQSEVVCPLELWVVGIAASICPAVQTPRRGWRSCSFWSCPRCGWLDHTKGCGWRPIIACRCGGL